MDLLTVGEEAADARAARLRFDIPLLGRRLTAIIDHLAFQQAIRGLRLGCFGASTGAAAALMAAAARPDRLFAVVSRGGRPDLAGPALGKVRAPTLLIVGGNDPAVLALNEAAMQSMSCEKRLQIVPGATHLFEEPGALDLVAQAAAEWFQTHLAAGGLRTGARA
jgi:pimeloyl-ACP methyl ester carboxylesterase